MPVVYTGVGRSLSRVPVDSVHRFSNGISERPSDTFGRLGFDEELT